MYVTASILRWLASILSRTNALYGIEYSHSENFVIVSGLDQLVFHGVWRSKKAQYGDSNHNWDKNGIWLIV
jgi:hypothetical protein